MIKLPDIHQLDYGYLCLITKSLTFNKKLLKYGNITILLVLMIGMHEWIIANDYLY
jgi:hypothetical protein